MSKSFVILLSLVLALGVSVGGAFAGGVALGKGQGSNNPVEASHAGFGPGGGQRGNGAQATGRAARDGQQSAAGGGAGPAGFGGRAGDWSMTGPIAKIEGNTLTIDTPGGPAVVEVGEETAISKVTDVGRVGLTEGARIRVMGQRGPDGAVAARTILIVPEGSEGFFGSGPARGGAPPRDRSGQ